MWSVNSGTTGCSGSSTTVELRRSADGVSWSAPTTTDLTDADGFAWHIDVQWIPTRSEFRAIYNVKIPGSCTTSTLRFAASADGVHWNVSPGPVLTRGVIPAFDDIVYRSSVLFDAGAGEVTLWYSGARYADNRYAWPVAIETVPLDDFLLRVATSSLDGTAIGVTSTGASRAAASLIEGQWARFKEVKQPTRDVSTSPHSAPPQIEAGILALLATPFLRLALQRKNQSAFRQATEEHHLSLRLR